jgi:hypothetical protein
MNQLVVFRFESSVDYQTCSKCYDDHARKNFQHLCIFLLRVTHVLFQFWLLSKQLDGAGEMRFFELVNVKISPYVEYKSWEK